MNSEEERGGGGGVVVGGWGLVWQLDETGRGVGLSGVLWLAR